MPNPLFATYPRFHAAANSHHHGGHDHEGKQGLALRLHDTPIAEPTPESETLQQLIVQVLADAEPPLSHHQIREQSRSGPCWLTGPSLPETGFPELCRYWAGERSQRRAGRRHDACDRRSTNDGRRSEGVIWTCPPSHRPKTLNFDFARIRFDDMSSAMPDCGTDINPLCTVRRLSPRISIPTGVGFPSCPGSRAPRGPASGAFASSHRDSRRRRVPRASLSGAPPG